MVSENGTVFASARFFSLSAGDNFRKLVYNNKIKQLTEEIENQEAQLTELVNLKNNFRNKEWKQEAKQNIEEIEEIEEETAVLPFIEEINVEEMEPIEEIQVEKFEPIE